jgi:LysR family transcriptional regulator, hydrogen peroxide-inducible genes activator
MFWRRSSALAPFLKKLAVVLADLPRGLLDPHMAPTPAHTARRATAH